MEQEIKGTLSIFEMSGKVVDVDRAVVFTVMIEVVVIFFIVVVVVVVVIVVLVVLVVIVIVIDVVVFMDLSLAIIGSNIVVEPSLMLSSLVSPSSLQSLLLSLMLPLSLSLSLEL